MWGKNRKDKPKFLKGSDKDKTVLVKNVGWVKQDRYTTSDGRKRVKDEVLVALTDFTGSDINLPLITVSNGIITPFTRNGVNYIEIMLNAGVSSLAIEEPVNVRWVVSGAGASGAVSSSINVNPGGSGAAMPILGQEVLGAGIHSFNIAVGAAAKTSQGPGNNGGNTIWTLANGSTRQSIGGGGGGAFGATTAEYNGLAGGNGGGGMCGSSAGYAGGASTAGGFAGSAGFFSATATERSAGAGAGAGAAGGAAVANVGGKGGDGIYLDWVAEPKWVCGGSGGGGATPGAAGKGGATPTVNGGTSLSAKFGSASGSVRAGTQSGMGGDGFGIFVVRADEAVVYDTMRFDADFTRVTYWGSSSSEYSGTAFSAMISTFGASAVLQGKASERTEQTTARIGSHPWALIFPSNTIPASGTVTVTVAGGNPSATNAIKTFAGKVNGISGTLAWNSGSSVLQFTRTETGDPLTLTGPATFHPDAAILAKKHPIVLWLGKNNLVSVNPPNTGEYVARMHDEVVEWLSPNTKRAIVIGQFKNTNTAANSAAAINVDTCNTILQQKYGNAYVDIVAWMRSDATWTRLGLTKTATDVEQLALGNLPPSLAASGGTDTMHFSTAAYGDIVNYAIKPVIVNLGWYN